MKPIDVNVNTTINTPEVVKFIDQIKAHVNRHKVAYTIGSTVVLTTSINLLLMRRFGGTTVINNTVSPIFNNTVNNGGHMRKIVRCVETGQLWLSVTDTAETLGKSLSVVSQHLNHPELAPDINGLHYVIEALATN